MPTYSSLRELALSNYLHSRPPALPALRPVSFPRRLAWLAIWFLAATATAQISFPNGFQATSTTLNGTAVVNAGALQLTDTNTINEAGSAFFPTPVDIRTFTTDFTFQLTNANADGFMFVLQNQGPNALGLYGQFLGYGGIQPSAGVKFDLYNNFGEGNNSTGFYDTGYWPGYPAIDLTPNQIDLHSGHVMQVHMTYDGQVLFVSLRDTVTGASVTNSYVWKYLTRFVGANTAYVGFTGGTGGLQATQQILSWTFTSGVAVEPPQLSPHTDSHGQTSVYLGTRTVGAQIYYTTDGSVPTANSTLYSYTSNVPINGMTTIKAVAILNGVASPVTGNTFTSSVPALNYVYPGGFDSSQITLNGTARIDVPNYNELVLTDFDPHNVASSSFYRTPVNVESFVCDFAARFNSQSVPAKNVADGMMFVIQNQGPSALGAYGQFLGFGNIPKSVGIKLDIYDNAGEGPESTGLYTNGAWAAIPAYNLVPYDPADVVGFLTGGYDVNVHLVYKRPILQVTMSNDFYAPYGIPPITATQIYNVDIPAIVGGNTAYIGFTAGTGGYTSQAIVDSWTYATP